MDFRRLSTVPIAGIAIVVLGVSACGGGGSSTPPIVSPTARPTPVPTATATSAAAAQSACTGSGTTCTYTIASSPSGIGVALNGAAIGVTPLTTSPPFSALAQTLSFANSTYTVPINQTASAARTVFYNSVVDTGSVSVTGNQSIARAAASTTRNTESVNVRALARFDRSPAVSNAGVYVRYDASKLGRRIEDMESSAGALGARDILSSVAAVRGRVVLTRSGSDVRALASGLQGQPGVIGVYPLHYRVPTAISYVQPNDVGFGPNFDQWDMAAIGATYAWSLTQGANAKIAIIDTGVDLSHPDLTNKIVYQASFVGGVSSTAAGAAQDTNGHGTNVAGIAAASTNDGTGFAGTGYNAKILAYRIFPPATATSDTQNADTGDEAAAISDAVTHGADVINLSLGSAQYDPASGSGFDQAEHDAIEAAIAANVSVVAASGNGDSNNVALATVDFPAAYDGVISVGASSIIDNNTGSWNPATGVFTGAPESVASYSNYGPNLSVVAPGGDTTLASNSSSSDDLHWIVNDSTQTANFAADKCRPVSLPQVCGFKFQGTSQSTPHVAGTVALVQSALREAGKPTLGSAAMLQLIESTADNINSPSQGHGRLNTLRAVASAIGAPLLNVPTPPPSSPTQFVAFAYTNVGAGLAKPAIADVTYPTGVLVSASGTFRIADIDPAKTTGSFKIGVWLDTNGDGVVDAGDQFGASAATCTATAKCTPGTIAVSVVTTTGL